MPLTNQFWLAFGLGLLFALHASGSSEARLMPSNSSIPVSARAQDGADVAINDRNWQQHPKIKKVRAIVDAVQLGLKKKSFKISKREFEYCEPYEDTMRTMAVDSKGHVRFYVSEGGSEDSSLKFQHYYDEDGHLRFVFITGGAVQGAQLEHRIYFDETGKRIWEKQKYLQGPAYTFPKVWPDEELQITDPSKAFAAASPCPETKHR